MRGFSSGGFRSRAPLDLHDLFVPSLVSVLPGLEVLDNPRGTLAMPKTTGVDMGAFLDAVEAERARLRDAVSRRGTEPLDWHEEPWNRPRGGRGRSGAGPPGTGAGPARPARSRSPVREAVPVVDGVLDEEWSWHFDGRIRPYRHGLVWGVDDALVAEGLDRRRSVFVDAFAENRVLRGRRILEHCQIRHRDGRSWEDVELLCEALRAVALAELRGGSGAALALLREEDCGERLLSLGFE